MSQENSPANFYAAKLNSAALGGEPAYFVPDTVAEWLRFWDDEQNDLANLKNLEYWLQQSQENRTAR